MYEELLKACGLTQNESLVYLTLLRVGKATSSKVVREAKISGGKIYETLDKLIQKGLVKSVIENGVKNFMASEPEMLIEYLRKKEKELHKKEKELEKIIPELCDLKEHKQTLENVSFIRGFRGLSSIIYEPLAKAKSIKIMGVTSKKDTKFNNFWKEWHKERAKLKKEALMIFSDKNTDYWKFYKNLKHTKVREILHFTPSAITIMDNNVFIHSYDGELTTIHIISDSIATSFSEFFDDLWKVAQN